MNKLVAYFSAEFGKTEEVAKDLAENKCADLFEIKPVKPYSKSDLNYKNPLARCNREKLTNKDVPIADNITNWDSYETVYLGFPIWYFGAPNVIKSFCKSYDWSSKKVYIFATSGSSGIGKSGEKLEKHMVGATILDAKRVVGIEDLADWE